jgi:hypothetical protein
LKETKMQTIGHRTQYKTQQVGDVKVFCRETGPPDPPVILLLHVESVVTSLAGPPAGQMTANFLSQFGQSPPNSRKKD